MRAIKYCIRLTAAAASAIALAACVAVEPGSETLEFDDQTVTDTSDHGFEYVLGSMAPLFDAKSAQETPLDPGDYLGCPVFNWESLFELCGKVAVSRDDTGTYSFRIFQPPGEEEFSLGPLAGRFRHLATGAWLAQIAGDWIVYYGEDEEEDEGEDLLYDFPEGVTTLYLSFEKVGDGFLVTANYCDALPDHRLVDLIRGGHLTQGHCVARSQFGAFEIVKASRAATGLAQSILLFPRAADSGGSQ